MQEIKMLVTSKFNEVWIKEIKYKNPLAISGQNNPQAYILGGQPGAGKSNLIKIAGNNLNKNTIVINGDDFRKYHPNYPEFQEKYKENSPKYTAVFAGAMTEAILEKAINDRYNIVIEGTFRTAQTPIKTLQNFKENGYKTNVLIQTCEKNISCSSCLERYKKMLEINPKEARHTDKAHHDLVVQNLSKNIKAVQESNLADNLQIFVRTPVKDRKNEFEQKEIYNSQSQKAVNTVEIDKFISINL